MRLRVVLCVEGGKAEQTNEVELKEALLSWPRSFAPRADLNGC